jgi:hypothetical protein
MRKPPAPAAAAAGVLKGTLRTLNVPKGTLGTSVPEAWPGRRCPEGHPWGTGHRGEVRP